MTLPETLVPLQSMTAATKGTGMPGAAIETMVKALTSPSVAISAGANVSPLQLAHAFLRSKYLAPQLVHS